MGVPWLIRATTAGRDSTSVGTSCARSRTRTPLVNDMGARQSPGASRSRWIHRRRRRRASLHSPGHGQLEERRRRVIRPSQRPSPRSSRSRVPSAATPRLMMSRPSGSLGSGVVPDAVSQPRTHVQLREQRHEDLRLRLPKPAVHDPAEQSLPGGLGTGRVAVVLLTHECCEVCRRAAIEPEAMIAGGVAHAAANSSGSASAIRAGRASRSGRAPSRDHGTRAPSGTAGRASSPRAARTGRRSGPGRLPGHR